MRTLASYTNYENSNVYVHRTLLLQSLTDFKSLLSRQYHNNVVEIPSYIVLDEIKKINSKLRAVNKQICSIEQSAFSFGMPIPKPYK